MKKTKFIYTYLLLIALCACSQIKTIDKSYYSFIPYKGDEKLLFRFDSIHQDTIMLCGFFEEEEFSKRIIGIPIYHQVRFLRCSQPNSSCDNSARYFLAYIFMNKSSDIGLGLNINFKANNLRFGSTILLKDTLKNMQKLDFYPTPVVKFKNSVPKKSNDEVEFVFWDLKKGLIAFKTYSGETIFISEVQ
jgi:hypothetical protein